MKRHPAQLRVCHEKIGEPRERRPLWWKARYPSRHKWAWCDLSAWAWCFDCKYYVCAIHYEANHALHRTQIEAERDDR